MTQNGETIAIASDHHGVELKKKMVAELTHMGFQVRDLGAATDAPTDYPDIAHPLAREVATGVRWTKGPIRACASRMRSRVSIT